MPSHSLQNVTLGVRLTVSGGALWHTSRMAEDTSKTASDVPSAAPPAAETENPPAADETAQPREVGGRKGPDPTRYGDWEKDGRCIDF